MAEFNVDAGGIPSPNMPDQTGASRGIDTNRAFEYLFKGLGDSIGGAATVIDTGIKTNVERDAIKGFEQVNKPYLDTVPAELKKSGSALQNLQTALEQGKISDTYYYGQLVSLTKQMRSKYPGYEQYVDETIQSVTGVRPANAYRSALMNEISDQQNAASDQAKFERQWIKDNEKEIGIFFPDYFINPEKYNFAEVRTKVMSWKADSEQVGAEKARLELAVSQNTVTDQQATEVASKEFQQIVSQNLSGLGNALGLDGSDFLEKINQMNSTGYTPEELSQITSQFATLKANITNQLNQAWNTYSGVIPGKKQEILSEAMSQINTIEDMIKNQDYGLAGYYTRLTGIQKSSEMYRILNKSPDLKTSFALSQINNDLSTMYLTQDGKQEGIFKDIAPEIAANINLGNDTLNDMVERTVKSSATSADKVGLINNTLNNLQKGIISGNLTPENMKDTISSLYSLDAKGRDIFSYINPEEYMPLYNRLFNDEMTTAIKTYGSAEDMQEYLNAARDRIFAIPEFSKAAANFGDLNSNWREFFEIIPSAKGTFSLNVKKGGVPLIDLTGEAGGNSGLLGAWMYTNDKRLAEQSINTLNIALDNLGRIAEAAGADPSMKPELYRQVIKELNIDLEQGKDGLFKMLLDLVGSLSQSDESVNQALQDSYDRIRFNVPGSTIEMGNTGDVITDTIIGFEGFRDTPYWDVNADRVGFGSDTITTADGQVRRVTKNDKVTREDAARDLNRRLTTEFIPEIVDDIGSDVWSQMTPNQQAALASIAYNYGSLPMKVVKAIKKGTPEEVVTAIQSLQVHNNGINRKRRLKEAELYLS